MTREQLDQFLILPDCTIVEAMQKIDYNSNGILFVIENTQKIIGTLTDGDIRRWLIKTGNLYETVKYVMNRNPIIISKELIIHANEYMKKYSITALPVTDPDGVILDIILREEKKQDALMTGSIALRDVPIVIMAGGKGTRLYPYTKVLPKPLIPIGDIPIIERIINKFVNFGVKKFFLTVNYKKGMIKSYFSDITTTYNLFYIEEKKPLGTAGSLQLINPKFNIPFIVTNCDILIDADYSDIYNYHKESGNELTIVVALKNIEVPYGVVDCSNDGIVKSISEKPKMSYFVNTGMYILNPDLLNEIPQDSFFHMTDLIKKLLNNKQRVGMYPISEDSFLDMGEFEEMSRMENKLALKSVVSESH